MVFNEQTRHMTGNRPMIIAPLVLLLLAVAPASRTASSADMPYLRPAQTAEMFIRIHDDRFAWTAVEQIPVLAYGWSGQGLTTPTAQSDVHPLTPDETRRSLLTIRRFQDGLSENFQEAYREVARFRTLIFVIRWPGGVGYRYRLTGARIFSMRQLATGEITALPYEEIGFAYDAIEQLSDAEN